MSRDELIRVRCTPDEKTRWAKLAEQAGMNLSEWMRWRAEASGTMVGVGSRGVVREQDAAASASAGASRSKAPRSTPAKFRPDFKGGRPQ